MKDLPLYVTLVLWTIATTIMFFRKQIMSYTEYKTIIMPEFIL